MLKSPKSLFSSYVHSQSPYLASTLPRSQAAIKVAASVKISRSLGWVVTFVWMNFIPHCLSMQLCSQADVIDYYSLTIIIISYLSSGDKLLYMVIYDGFWFFFFFCWQSWLVTKRYAMRIVVAPLLKSPCIQELLYKGHSHLLTIPNESRSQVSDCSIKIFWPIATRLN